MADRQALRALKADVTGWNESRRQARSTDPTAEGVDLRGADISGLGLSRVDLQGAHLEGANLRRSVLHGADLRRARLNGADLTGADLEGAQLEGASWDNQTQWPDGFSPPSPPKTATQGQHVSDLVRPVRLEHLDPTQLTGLIRSVEPLLTAGERLLDSGSLSERDERSLEHRLGQLRRELYEDPDSPDPTLIEANLRRLLDTVSRLASRGDLERAGQDSGHDVQPVLALAVAVAQPTQADRTAAGEGALELAGILEELVEEPDVGVTRADEVLKLLRWGTGGAIAGMELQALVAWMPKPWAAVVGAVVGLLANVYEGRPR